jgi:hypothetical protein
VSGVWYRNFYDPKKIGKNRTENLARMNTKDQDKSDFEILNEVTLMRRCLSGYNKREVKK